MAVVCSMAYTALTLRVAPLGSVLYKP